MSTTPPDVCGRPRTRCRVQLRARGHPTAMAFALAGVLLAGTAHAQTPTHAGRMSRASLAQLPTSEQPAAPHRFRYDEASGRCLDAEGREGYKNGTREELEMTSEAECTNFSGRGLNLTYLSLTRVILRGANFAKVLFYLGSITDSDLTGANLSGTRGQMNYRGSSLRKARLSGADLSWADLRDTDLSGADLHDARFSQHARLPFDHDEARRRGMVFVPKP